MTKLNAKGFGAVEGLLILVIVALVGGVGYYVYNQNNTEAEKKTSTAAPKESQEVQSTKCGKDWTTIEHATVEFVDWGVTVTVDESLLGKAVCRKDPNQNPLYLITAKEVIEEKCYEHLKTLALADPVVSIYQYEANQSAVGNLYIDERNGETFQQYYEKNKSDDGDYVLTSNGDAKYYKAGENFYYETNGEVFDNVGQDMDKSMDGVQSFEIDEKELKSNCPTVEPGYLSQFGELAPTLKAVD